MKAVILAGGQGSRLRPLTEDIPKPMVPILGRPIMHHIIRHIARFGFNDILATLHYRPRTIRDRFGDGSDLGVNITYSLEKEPLGTAGSVKLSQAQLDEPFIVVSGDALVDFDFGKFLAFHREKNAKVSLCLTHVRNPGEFGIVITDDDGRVERFFEKPGPSEVFSDTVNTGIYLIEPEILDYVPENQAYDFASDLFPDLLDKKIPMYGYVANGYWSDIGTIEQLCQAHWDMLEDRVRLPIDGTLIREGIWVGEGDNLNEDVHIEGPCWLGDDVRIGHGALIGPYAVISPNVEIDKYANINRSIIFRNSYIGEGCDLRNAVVAAQNIIEERCEIGEDAVIGSSCRIGRESAVKPGIYIWPDKVIEARSLVSENLVWESLHRPSMFGSRGVMGLANLHVTPEFSVGIGKAFGNWVSRGHRVTVSRDAHPFSLLAKRALVSGLLSVGVDVDDLEQSTGPVTRLLCGYLPDISGGVHVRIADNNPNVVLIEMYTAEGLPLRRKDRRAIEATFYRADYPKVSIDQVGVLRYPGRVHERYLELLLECVDIEAISQFKEKIILYSADERTSTLLADILRLAQVKYLQAGGLHETNSNELTTELAETARLNSAICIIIERNAEHICLIDNHGNIQSVARMEELLTAIFIKDGQPGEAVYLPPDHTAFLIELARQHDRKAVITRKDPAFRLDQITRSTTHSEKWLEFVHYYLNYDALAGVLHFLGHLGKEQLTLREFIASIPTSFKQNIALYCPWDQMGRVMRELSLRKNAYSEDIPEGIRLLMDGGRVYVLPSADMPELEVTIEGDDKDRLNAISSQVKHELTALIS